MLEMEWQSNNINKSKETKTIKNIYAINKEKTTIVI